MATEAIEVMAKVLETCQRYVSVEWKTDRSVLEHISKDEQAFIRILLVIGFCELSPDILMRSTPIR